ncbi:MAG: MmcQ/YjbR family DNA-binding protein [Candidatus Binataceae bacterium]
MAHSKKYHDPEDPIKRLREICLALPKATEKEAWGECTFRIGGKMFAMTDDNHHDSGRVAVWLKSTPIVQEIFINSDPKRFFKPPYVGHKGWLGARIDGKPNWGMLTELLKDAYEMIAPKKKTAPTRSASGKTRRTPRAKAKKTVH